LIPKRMSGFLMMLMLALAGAATRVDAATKCQVQGEPAVIVMTDEAYCDQAVPRAARAHDPNGKGGNGEVWKGNPPQPRPSLIESLESVSSFDAHYWLVRATADFDGDGECDVVWTRCPDTGTEMAITLTPASGQITAPSAALFLVPGEELVGSGDFVCAPGRMCGPGPVSDPALGDGVPDLVWWNPTAKTLTIWASDGLGGFPTGSAYRSSPAIDGPVGAWKPAAIANLDGAGLPEIVWRNTSSGNFVYWGFTAGGARPTHSSGGFLVPSQPADPNWTLSGAADFDGDGKDDLLFQNDCSDRDVVWYMNGAVRQSGEFLGPSVFPPHDSTCEDGPYWTVYGPR